MTRFPVRRVLLAPALVLTIGATAACGGSHPAAKASAARTVTAAPAPSSTSGTSGTASATPSATGPAPLTEAQLTLIATAITQAGAPGLKEDTSDQSTGVNDEKQKAGSGGAACETFLNALQAYSGTYGSSAEVDRGYDATTTNGQELVLLSLVSHTSAAAARRTVDDVRKSAKDCPHLTADLGGETGRMNLAPLSRPAMGDGSAVVRIGMTQGSTKELITTATAQVGSTTVNVFDISGSSYDYGAAEQVTKEAVTLLRNEYPQ